MFKDKQALVNYVRQLCFMMAYPVSHWTDDEVFNLGTKNWGLQLNTEHSMK